MVASKRSLRLALLLLGVPAAAAAHVKWFVAAETIAPAEGLGFHPADPAVQVWAGVTVLLVAAAYLLERRGFAPPPAVLRFGQRRRGLILYMFQLIVGLSLLAAAFQGAVLVPHLRADTVLGLGFRVAEGLVGALLVTNLLVFWGALLLLVLYLATTAVFGLLVSLEYLNLLGIAVFLILSKAPESSSLVRGRPWALPLLRVTLGLAVSVLAFSEKLLRPELAMEFLARHNLNFMAVLGFESFSNQLFVLSAGCSELVFGLIFLMGFITRINTITIAGFLVTTNVYFFVLGKTSEGLLELAGHANLVAIAVILAFYGAGERLRFRPRGRAASAPEGGAT
ncbi:MAG: hypothetical protein ACYDA8_23620 [Deferrisomatales bacterium]